MGLRHGHNAVDWRRCWGGVAALAVVAVLLESGGGEVRGLLAWDRTAIGAGDWWRLLSGHLVHLGWSHLLLNLAGLAVVAWVVGGAYACWRWLLIAGLSVAVIDAGFWLLDPQLEWYVGLSGVLHGLLVAGLLPGVLARDREALVLAACVVAKLAWEQLVGPLPGSAESAGGNVIVNAHLYGAVGGLLGALPVSRGGTPAAPI